MHSLLLLLVVAAGLAGCAGRVTGPRFEDMTAAQHRQAAAREQRAAIQEAEKARDQLGPASSLGESEAFGPGGYRFFDPTWDPLEPEFYTIDHRIHVPGEDHADRARRHREKALRHEQAADQMEGRRRVE